MSNVVEQAGAPATAGAPVPSQPGQVRGFGAIARQMTGLTPGLIAYNMGYLALTWAIVLGGIGLYWAHPAWYTFVLAFLLVSSRQQALLNIEHESIHGKLVPWPRLNEFLGRYVCAAPVGSPYGASRHRHLTHHRLLGTPEDPDHDLHAGEVTQTRGGLAKHFIGGLLGGYAGMVLMGPRAPQGKGVKGSAVTDLVSLVIAQAVLAALLTALFSWWVYPALWLAPLGTVTVLAHLVRSFAEHAITDDEAPVHANRLITIHSNLIERGLVAPYNMNYHAEHHILPSVPAPRLPELQRRLDGRDDKPPVLVRSSYGGAIRRFTRSLRA